MERVTGGVLGKDMLVVFPVHDVPVKFLGSGNVGEADIIGVRTEYQICRVDVTSGESQEQVPLFVLKAAAELGRKPHRGRT